ncbi:MAG: hypothetical protein IPM63_16285 [Acidobacteriota bacterium]|nr:MAG: hypothetical protein IPM63_16285 [Acidobacteriota bacterium]
MKILLFAAILGYGCWLVSEVFEIVQRGYSPEVYYLTAAYHVLAGIGVWGIYKAQTAGKNLFNLAATAIASIAYLSFAIFPLQVMWSGLSMAEFVAANPAYKLAGLVWFVGMILFSVSVTRTGYFPRWTGVIMVIGTVVFTATPIFGWPMLLVNFTNIFFAGTVVYTGFLGLRAGTHLTTGSIA